MIEFKASGMFGEELITLRLSAIHGVAYYPAQHLWRVLTDFNTGWEVDQEVYERLRLTLQNCNE